MAKENKQVTYDSIEEVIEAEYKNTVELLENGNIFDLTDAQLSNLMAVVAARDPNHPALKRAEERLAQFKAENNLEENDYKIYEENAEFVDDVAEHYGYEEMVSEDKDIKSFVDQVEVTETVVEDGKTEERPLSIEKKNEYLAALFKATQEEAKLSFYGDKEFNKKRKTDKTKAVKGTIKDLFVTKLITTATGSALETPTAAEQEVGSNAFKEYIKRQAKVARQTIRKFGDAGKVAIKTDQILASIADGASKVDNYVGVLRQKASKLSEKGHVALNNLAARVKTGWQQVEKTANYVSENRYEIYKNLKKGVKNNFKDNKVQTISNLAATAALSLAATAGAPVTAVALGAYGVYMAAGSWVHPLITETRKIARERKEAGLEPISFKERWKIAKTNKLAKTVIDPETGQEIENKERKKYIRRAAVTTGIAVVSFGLLSRAVAKASRAANAADLVKGTLKDSGLVRIAAPIAAQATDYGFAKARVAQAKKAAKLENSAAAQKELLEAKGESRQAAIGLVAGVALAVGVRAGSQYISSSISGIVSHVQGLGGSENVAAEAAHSVASTSGQAPYIGWQEGDMFWKPENDSVSSGHIMLEGVDLDGAEADIDTSSAAATEVDVEVSEADFAQYKFPMEYSEDMGISKRQYNAMMSRMPGILRDYDGATPDRLWNNVNDEFMSHFEGKTKMQAIYETLALARNSRRSQLVLGNSESGFYINTPTGRAPITDEGIIAQAKEALANGDKIYVNRLHGREFLRGQFENLKLEGMTDEKMSEAVEISMQVYDPSKASVSEAAEKIHELFPDMSAKELAKVSEIVKYNVRFEQNGETLEDLLKAMGCGDELKNPGAANDLLVQTNEILGRSTGSAMPIGQDQNCEDVVVHIVKGHKVVEPVYEPEPVQEPVREPLVSLTKSAMVMEAKAEAPQENLLPPEPKKAPTVTSRHMIVDGHDQTIGKKAPLVEERFDEQTTAEKVQPKHFNQEKGTTDPVKSVSAEKNVVTKKGVVTRRIVGGR